MPTLPLATVKAQLSALVDQVEDTHERVVITRNGRPAAVLLGADELESLEETLDILSDPDTMRRLAEADAAIARGEGLNEAEFLEYIAKNRPSILKKRRPPRAKS